MSLLMSRSSEATKKKRQLSKAQTSLASKRSRGSVKPGAAQSTSALSPKELEQLTKWQADSIRLLTQRVTVEKKKLGEHFSRQRTAKKKREGLKPKIGSRLGEDFQAVVPDLLSKESR